MANETHQNKIYFHFNYTWNQNHIHVYEDQEPQRLSDYAEYSGSDMALVVDYVFIQHWTMMTVMVICCKWSRYQILAVEWNAIKVKARI